MIVWYLNHVNPVACILASHLHCIVFYGCSLSTSPPPWLLFVIVDEIDIFGKVTYFLVKVVQNNRLTIHFRICDTINKALEALDTPIPISSFSSSSDDIILVVVPLPDTVKLPMDDVLCIIVPVQDKGYRLILSEVTYLLEVTNLVFIRIIAELMEKLVCCHLNNL